MAERPRNILICSCEDSMPLNGEAVRKVCRGADVIEGRQLCRAELERFRKVAAGGEPMVVACTQEAPLFEEAAGAIKDSGAMTFVNIRETAGWSKDAKSAGPKMAALIAMAAEPASNTGFVPLNSEGVTLIYGKDEKAIEAANLLKDQLDVTVLIKPPGAMTPLRVTEFPVVKGSIRQAKGYLGAFELTVDDYAAPAPSSRGELAFGAARRCSPRPICATAICAPIRAIRPRCCARCSRRAISPVPSTSRATLCLPRICVRIRAARSSAAAAASISARPARFRPTAITLRSIRRFAPAADNAPPPAQPAPRPTRCRDPTHC